MTLAQVIAQRNLGREGRAKEMQKKDQLRQDLRFFLPQMSEEEFAEWVNELISENFSLRFVIDAISGGCPPDEIRTQGIRYVLRSTFPGLFEQPKPTIEEAANVASLLAPAKKRNPNRRKKGRRK